MLEVRAIAASETWALRQAILRPHQSIAEMAFPGDDAPLTRHFGAFGEAGLVGIASVYREDLPERPGLAGWRLRAMAVKPEGRMRGTGASLVGACLECARSSGGKILWCNARENAMGFYSALGFECVRGPFDIPGIGPHFLLTLPL